MNRQNLFVVFIRIEKSLQQEVTHKMELKPWGANFKNCPFMCSLLFVPIHSLTRVHCSAMCFQHASRWLCFQALAQNSELRERLRKIHAESLVVEPNHINLTAAKVGAGLQRPPLTHHVFSLGPAHQHRRLSNCIPTDFPFLTAAPGHVASGTLACPLYLQWFPPLCARCLPCVTLQGPAPEEKSLWNYLPLLLSLFPSFSAGVIRFAGHRERADLLNHVLGNLSNTQCETKRSSSGGGIISGAN